MFRTVCLLLISACLAMMAAAQTNRALIVGVGEYAELTDLQKTVGDASGYSGVFADDLGFEVTPLINPDTDTFLEQFDAFLQTIQPGDRVAFIFSGHGWSDGGQNYLALSDAPYHSSLLGPAQADDLAERGSARRNPRPAAGNGVCRHRCLPGQSVRHRHAQHDQRDGAHRDHQ